MYPGTRGSRGGIRRCVHTELWVLEHVSAWPLAGPRGCSRSQCSGAVSGVELFEEDRLIPVLTGTCYSKSSKTMLALPTSTWKGAVAFQRLIKAAAVLGMQQKRPAQALAGSSGAPSSHRIAPRAAHPLGCRAGSGRWSRERRPGWLCSSGLPAPALGWHSCLVGTVLPPWEFVGHLSPRFAGMMRYLSSQVSVAWEQVNGNAK